MDTQGHNPDVMQTSLPHFKATTLTACGALQHAPHMTESTMIEYCRHCLTIMYDGRRLTACDAQQHHAQLAQCFFLALQRVLPISLQTSMGAVGSQICL